MSELQGVTFRVLHQYREMNQAADFLAKQGELGSNSIYDTYDHLPRLLKGIVRIDKVGLPAIRT